MQEPFSNHRSDFILLQIRIDTFIVGKESASENSFVLSLTAVYKDVEKSPPARPGSSVDSVLCSSKSGFSGLGSCLEERKVRCFQIRFCKNDGMMNKDMWS